MSAAPRAKVFDRLAAVTTAGAAAMIVYWRTAAPSAWWGDGLELTCAAKTLGIAHPPGYPLFVIIGWIITHLFFWVDPGRALTLACAACTALGVAILTAAFLKPPAAAGEDAALLAAPRTPWFAAALGLALALSRSLWDQATFVEVYPLTFLCACSLAALGWTTPAKPRRPVRRAAMIGALGGLGMLNHYSIVALAPLAVIAVWQCGDGLKGRAACLGAATLAFCVMLLGYLYLPLRAAANPPLNWGNPADWRAVKWMLTGGQFGQVFVEGGGVSKRDLLARWVIWWGNQWLPLKTSSVGLKQWWGVLWLAPVVFGLIRLFFSCPGLAAGFLFSLAATAAFSVFYHIPDIDSYFLVALPAAGAGWFSSGEAAGAWLQSRRGAPLSARHGGYAVALATLPFWMHFRALDKSWDDGPRAYGEAAMKALPEGAIVLTYADNDIYALWYQQMALGKRPDVTVCGSRFIFSGWYAKYFESRGRPARAIRIEDRPISKYKLDFDVALFRNVLLPAVRRGEKLYSTFQTASDGVWTAHARPKPVAQVIDPQYYLKTRYEFYIPDMWLCELDVDRSLLDKDEAALYALFRIFYQRPPR